MMSCPNDWRPSFSAKKAMPNPVAQVASTTIINHDEGHHLAIPPGLIIFALLFPPVGRVGRPYLLLAPLDAEGLGPLGGAPLNRGVDRHVEIG